MRVNGILSLLSRCDVCSADFRSICSGRDDGPLQQQRQAGIATFVEEIAAAWLAQLVEMPVCCAGGRGFEPQTGPTLRVLK